MPRRSFLLPAALLSAALCASADAGGQVVNRGTEQLDADRPEAWAMNYFTATSFMTGFGAVPELHPGQWGAALELGHIPSLSNEQQRVGFIGSKAEDLNKSPVIGRVRGLVGLPGDWVAEIGYTPPLEINGTRTRSLIAGAIGRRILMRGDFTLSMRLFGQHGSVSGDITCPAELAGVEDGAINPYGCQAPSDDRLRLNHYGFELTPSLRRGAWQWHSSVAVVRVETEVQVDAFTYDVHDLSRLTAKAVLPAIAIGTTRAFGRHWRWGAEVLYVPLQVERDADGSRENDPLTSVRLHLRYQTE